jgi:hypothetical protein
MEIEESGSRKHCLGNLVNASALGRVGLLVARNKWTFDIFVRERAYLKFLGDVEKNTFKTANGDSRSVTRSSRRRTTTTSEARNTVAARRLPGCPVADSADGSGLLQSLSSFMTKSCGRNDSLTPSGQPKSQQSHFDPRQTAHGKMNPQPLTPRSQSADPRPRKSPV